MNRLSPGLKAGSLDRFSTVPVAVEVELDRRSMSIREILALDVGSVIRMNKSAGENADLVVGGRRMGSGEIVVIEGKMAIRITSLEQTD